MMKKILLLIQIILAQYCFAQITTLTTGSAAGAGSWTVPCGVTTITISCWGGGGGGGNSTTTQAGGGGGSGGFSQAVISTTTGTIYSYTVGAGAAGGGSGLSGADGGATTFSTVIAGGGFGGAVLGTGGGAGGSGSTTPGSAGANPSGTTGGNGGNAPSGGAGGAGGLNGADGSNGIVPGGGGGAAGQRSGGAENSGNGANGRVTIAYVFPIVDAVASATLASCTTTSSALTATAITAPGWTGSWQCVGCTGITIASPTSAATTASGFAPGSISYFQWVATYSTGCSVYDDLNITVPACPITNDNCANATVLTIDAGLMCGQSTTGGSIQASECAIALPPPNAGLSIQSLWYRFTATNDSLVLNLAGYGTYGPPSIIVFGPFAPGGGCLPACTSTVMVRQGNSGDPGVHTLLTGLSTTGNNEYLIAIDGYGNLNWDFCINLANPAINSTAPVNALLISNCGATYNGSTNGGYYPSGGNPTTGFNNLDNNNATKCAACPTAGQDVTFVINNISWFKFCSVNAGTYNVQFDVLSCVFSGANSGSQMAILTGSDNNLTNVWQATNPTYTQTAIQTSPNFALAAGECAYLIVDGFAGDACSYSYVLNNVTGGCILLPVELLSFNALLKSNNVELTWATASEKNNAYFILQKSKDGINFIDFHEEKGAGTNSNAMFYSAQDHNPYPGISYYRLKQTDYSGSYTYSKIISLENGNETKLKFAIVPNPTEENKNSTILFSSIPNGNVLIAITDIHGVTVYENKLKMENNKLEIQNDFAKGIYFVKVITGNLIETKRMIVR